METTTIDIIAGLILFALLAGIGYFWGFAITKDERNEVREFEDAKLNNKLEDE